MNYIDLGFIVLLALSLFFGLFGKAKKKIKKMLVMIASVITSYFTFDIVKQYLYSINIEGVALSDTVIGTIQGWLSSNETLATAAGKIMPIAEACLDFGLFWIEILAGIIVFNIIFSIILVFFKAEKPVKARHLLGIPSLISGAITWLYVLLPFLFIAPVLQNVNGVVDLLPEGTIPETVMVYVDEVAKQMKESKLIQHSSYIFTFEGNKVMEYEVEGEKKNLYNEIVGIADIAKAAPLVSALADGGNPIEALKEMSTEDLTAVLEVLDENKELITTIVPAETFTELGINIEEINFKEEAPALEVVLDIVEFDEEGEMSFNLENLDNKKLADALVSSELLGAFVQPGMLSEVPEENKTEIIASFDEKLTAGEIDQAEYDKLVSYFNAE